MSEGSPGPGWYPDPAGSGRQRWWDGSAWTDSFDPAGPVESVPPPRAQTPQFPDLPPVQKVAPQQLPGLKSPAPEGGRPRRGLKVLGGVAAVLLLAGGAVGGYFIYKATSDPGARVGFVSSGGEAVVTADLDGENREEIELQDADDGAWGTVATSDGKYFVTTAMSSDLSFIQITPTSDNDVGRAIEGSLPKLTREGEPRIFFQRYEDVDDSGSVFVVDANGGEPEEVGQGELVDITDDGSKVLVSEYGSDDDDRDFFLIDVASGSQEELEIGYAETVTDMSPEGDYVYSTYYWSYRDSPSGYLFDVALGSSEEIEGIGTGYFSPDGERLVVEDSDSSWYVMDVDSRDQQYLGPIGYREPAFVPGSEKIVMSQDLGGSDETDYRLFVIDPEAGDEDEIAEGDDFRVSPEGDMIAFVRDEGTGDDYEPAVFTINIDGSGEKRIGEGDSPAISSAP